MFGHYKINHFATSLSPLTSSYTREIVVDMHTLGSDSWKSVRDVPHPETNNLIFC